MPEHSTFKPPVTLWDHLQIAMVRERQDFQLTVPQPGGHYIQFGSGYKLIAGYKNWDQPQWDADSGDPIPLPEESVDGIVCYHSLDHMSKPIWVMGEFQRVLKTGAWLVVVVPHYASELANTCLNHVSRFGVDTWRNMMSERQYVHFGDQVKWQLHITFNMIMGLTERNTVLVTQFVKIPEISTPDM